MRYTRYEVTTTIEGTAQEIAYVVGAAAVVQHALNSGSYSSHNQEPPRWVSDKPNERTSRYEESRESRRERHAYDARAAQRDEAWQKSYQDLAEAARRAPVITLEPVVRSAELPAISGRPIKTPSVWPGVGKAFLLACLFYGVPFVGYLVLRVVWIVVSTLFRLII